MDFDAHTLQQCRNVTHVALHSHACAQGINRTLLSWLRLWDEVVFNRPVPLKASTVPAKPGGGGAKPGGGGPGNKETPKGKKFEKRVEVQDPSTFAGQDVSFMEIKYKYLQFLRFSILLIEVHTYAHTCVIMMHGRVDPNYSNVR